jgi:hypothetical protein
MGRAELIFRFSCCTGPTASHRSLAHSPSLTHAVSARSPHHTAPFSTTSPPARLPAQTSTSTSIIPHPPPSPSIPPLDVSRANRRSAIDGRASVDLPKAPGTSEVVPFALSTGASCLHGYSRPSLLHRHRQESIDDHGDSSHRRRLRPGAGGRDRWIPAGRHCRKPCWNSLDHDPPAVRLPPGATNASSTTLEHVQAQPQLPDLTTRWSDGPGGIEESWCGVHVRRSPHPVLECLD